MEGPNNQGGWKKFQNLINGGGQTKWGVEFVKLFEMIKKQWKEQKQVVRKHKTLIVLTKKGNEMRGL